MRFEEGSLGSEAIGSVPWKRTRIERARLNEIASFIDGSTVRTLLVVIRRSKQSTRNWNETPNRWLIAQDGPSPFCFRERFHAPLTFYQYFRFFTYNDFAVVSTFPRPLAISEIKQLSILFYLLPILSISRLKATAFDFLNRFDFPFDRSRCEEISRTKYNRRRTWSCVCVHVHTYMYTYIRGKSTYIRSHSPDKNEQMQNSFKILHTLYKFKEENPATVGELPGTRAIFHPRVVQNRVRSISLCNTAQRWRLPFPLLPLLPPPFSRGTLHSRAQG